MSSAGALVTIPLGWETFLAINEHRASAYLLLAIDSVVLVALCAWLAWDAYHIDSKLARVTRAARDSTLRDLSRLLPGDARQMVTSGGQRAIDLYDRVANEPLGGIGRASRLITIAGTLAPTIIRLVTAISVVVHVH